MKTRLQLMGRAAIVAICVVLFSTSALRASTVYYVGNGGQDAALQNHITGLGHTVVAVSGTGTAGFAEAQAAGADVIVISGSITSSLANNRGYHTSTIPILHFEPAAYDNFGWTAVGSGDYMDSAGPHDTLAIVDASHPITSGFSVGNHTVLVPTSIKRFGFATPSGDADTLATIYSTGTEKGANKPALFVYERGDSLARATEDVPSVSTAKSRYIGFFLDNFSGVPDLLAEMNANGVKLFDQALGHALDPRRAHWTFDDDFTDAVGDNDGTAVNGASVTHASGKSIVGKGAASLVRASGQYVNVNETAGELETGDQMSVSLWFNTDYTGGPGNHSHQLFSAHSATDYNVFRLGTTPTGGIFLNPSGLAGDEKVAGSGYADGQWHFLTASLDGTNVRVTVDAQEIGAGVFSNTAGNPQWTNATKFSIGQEYDPGGSTGDYFNGYIDDVQLWGSALTQTDVEALRATALGPRFHWTFDSNFDDSIGGIQGTPQGGASITGASGEWIVEGGGALSLVRSSSQYVAVDGLAGEMASGNDVTLTMWFKTDYTGGPGPQSHQLFSAHNAGHGNLFRLGTTATGGIFLNPGGSDAQVGSGFNDDQWHFLAVAMDGNVGGIWVDGQYVGTISGYSGNPDWSSATLFSFGQEWDGGPGDFFDGFMDDFRIYGRLLSGSEISEIYAATVPEPSALALLGLGSLALFLCRTRRRK